MQIENELAEQTVIGSILSEPELIDECTLSVENFTFARHKILFKAFRDLDKRGIRIEPATVFQELGGDRLAEIGGTGYLMELLNSIPTTADFEMNQRLVHYNYQQRKLQEVMSGFIQNPDEDNLANVAREIDSVVNESAAASEGRSDQEVLVDLMESLGTDQGDLSGITTGSHALNEMTNGLQDSDLIVVAARPSVGKSAFAINVALAAAQKGTAVDLFSMEMPKKTVLQRSISAIGRVNNGKWRNPKRLMNDEDVQRITKAIGIYSQMNIKIHDESSQTVLSIRSVIRKAMRDNPNQRHLLIIDYLGYVKALGKFDRSDQEIGSITKGLKQIARKYNIPVLLLCQLSRGVEQRQDKRPMMSDLRDSGNIEQDADVIMFLYRDEYYNRQTDKQNIAEVIVSKQRNGPTGTIELAFLKEYGKFCDLERRAVLQ